MAAAAAGVVGLWLAQALAARCKAAPAAAVRGAEDARASGSRRGLGSSVASSADSSPAKKARAPSLAAGMLVCFKDRHGQVAIVSPTGSSGRDAWELVPTCASGGVVSLSAGARARARGGAR